MEARDRFMMMAGRLGSQRHLASLRDSFAATMPIVFVGSFVTVINQIPNIINGITGKDTAALPSWLSTINGNVWWGSLGMMTIILIIALGYNLTESYEGHGMIGSLVAFATYISIVPQVAGESWGLIAFEYTSATSLFVGILSTIAVIEIYTRLTKNEKLLIKMPQGVPPAVSRSFSSLIPAVASIYIVVAVVFFFEMLVGSTIFAFVVTTITTPLQGLSNTLPSALVIIFLRNFLWLFGLHGPNILGGITDPVLLPLILENGRLATEGLEPIYIVTMTMLDSFVSMGGAGATLGLIIAVYMIGKAKTLRSVTKLSTAPGIFNINEPIIFGLPIVLNPILGIPFILAPLAMTVVAYFSMSLGLVAKTIVVVPWAMPPFLSGYIATGGDWKSLILTAVNLAIAVAIYMPFVAMADKQEMKKEQELESEA